MVETAIHVREGKVEIEIKTDKVSKLSLEPNEVIDLCIKLLRAAYATRSQSG
ncbi:MAG: hypothetical protein ACFFCW_21680 [Candidatus Hodarchaeota archaeon]